MTFDKKLEWTLDIHPQEFINELTNDIGDDNVEYLMSKVESSAMIMVMTDFMTDDIAQLHNDVQAAILTGITIGYRLAKDKFNIVI